MKLEMISTGEEVLSGQIVDTNAPWFSNLMMENGIELHRRVTVGDRLEDLVSAFLECSQSADIILVNGGLGPTSDDLSAEAAAKALNEPLIEDKGWREQLESWFKLRNRTMPVSNIKQCMLPRSATLIDNPSGSAPGFRIKLNDAWLFFTPGVPSEFKQMVQEQFLPFFKEKFSDQTTTLLHRLLTLGHGESALADQLLQLTCPENITLGFRPSMPHVEIKIFARGNRAIAEMDTYISSVKKLLGNAIVAENIPTLAEALHQLLIEKEHSLSIAESCTGGLLTSQLIEFPGSSSYLQQGLVTYSNNSKQQLLGVSEQTLIRHGAVSIETAKQMAEGVRKLQDSDFALATTGVAGPEGGSEEKPVGTVCIALASRKSTWVQTVLLSRRSRSLVRTMSCAIALDMLRRKLLDSPVIIDYPFIIRTQEVHTPIDD